MKTKLFIFIAILMISNIVFAQRPGGGGPPRDGRPPQDGRPPRPDDRNDDRDRFPPMRGGDDRHDWQKAVDSNKNGKIETDEFRSAADTFFKRQDKNNNGVLEQNEFPMPRNEGRPPKDEIPPFLFVERDNNDLTRADFDTKVNLKFITVDANGDGVIDEREMTALRPPEKPPFPRTAMATFIGAELRFGDKIIKDAPFSAETIREESKRLFDGSLIKNQSKGLIYRDGFGRTRQEQPFEFIGGFAVVGENNQPKRLVNIVDTVAGNGYSVDAESKTFYKYPMQAIPPFPRQNNPKDAKIESLGTKNIEGVNAEGTKTTIEIPAGQIGNDKPIYVVTEKWFSPELQVIVLSKHSDPFIGEVVFKLVNIKLGEPAADLFKIPSDYKLQNLPKRDGRKDE